MASSSRLNDCLKCFYFIRRKLRGIWAGLFKSVCDLNSIIILDKVVERSIEAYLQWRLCPSKMSLDKRESFNCGLSHIWSWTSILWTLGVKKYWEFALKVSNLPLKFHHCSVKCALGKVMFNITGHKFRQSH